MKLKTLLLGAVQLLLLCASAGASQNMNAGFYDTVHIVPAPGPVTIDGDLSDWDKSGGFYTYRFKDDEDRRNVTGYMMYDADYLYIAAHIADTTPMMNFMNPDSEARVCWQGDCLTVRMSTDPALGYPLKGYDYQPDAASMSDGIVHIDMWYYTPKSQPCLELEYSMNFHGQVVNPPGYTAAYKKDADNRGYTLEYAIPWTVLCKGGRKPEPGDQLACVWQPLWSDAEGRHNLYDLSEICNPQNGGFPYQDPGCWGKAIMEPRGHLPPGTVVRRLAADEKKPEVGFLPIHYDVPGHDPAHVSMQIYDAGGNTVRWLLGDAPRAAGANTELWNGLNNDGAPVPPGRYTVKWCYSRGIKAKLLATADNPGTPPYNTSDGTGSWAGDYGTPEAVTATATNVFIAHTSGEASRQLIKVTSRGQRIWGVDTTGELGYGIIDMCNDGADLYVLQGLFLGPDSKCGIVKISCATGFNDAIGATGQAFVVLAQPKPGPGLCGTKVLSGIAVNDDTIFVSSEEAGQIYLIDKATGKQKGAIDNIDHPRGMAIGPDGRLYVAAKEQVVSMKLDGSDQRVLVSRIRTDWNNDFEPHRIAVDRNGDFYVSARGTYQCVLRFAANGTLLNEIGRHGGRGVPGPWVNEAMLHPQGIAMAPDGKLWVCEETYDPKRTSVWMPDGRYVTQYIGPTPYSGGSVVDQDDPNYVYSCNTKFRMNFQTGRADPEAVVFKEADDLKSPFNGHTPILFYEPQFMGISPQGFSYARFIDYGGRRFVFVAHMDECGSELDEVRNDRLIPLVNLGSSYPSLGIDRNLNGQIDADEIQVTSNYPTGLHWCDDNLTLYFSDSRNLWKVPLEGFDRNGVPNYNVRHKALLLTVDTDYLKVSPGATFLSWTGQIDAFMVDHDGNIYLMWNSGPERIKRDRGFLDTGHRLAKFSPTGKLLWEYRNIVVSHYASRNTVISKPGEIIGAIKFTGEFGRYITLDAYYGQYIILDKETGLYITSFTPDMRSEPVINELSILVENFNGSACYAPKTKQYLYAGGDADARVWQIDGLEDVKYKSQEVAVTPEDVVKARAAVYLEVGVGNTEKVLMAKSAGSVSIDGNLDDWGNADWVSFGVDDARKARASVRWSSVGPTPCIYVAFDVTDSSPMMNRGGNNNMLFKTGDVVEFCLSSAAADADRKDEQPILGDKRVLISMVKDQPVIMVYEPKSAVANPTPGTFFSTTNGAETFDNVAPLQRAQVAIVRRADGYTVEARLDASELGFNSLEIGQKLRGDFGVRFSDKGATYVLARSMWADDSGEVAITNDIPTEVRIHPKRWGWLVLR